MAVDEATAAGGGAADAEGGTATGAARTGVAAMTDVGGIKGGIGAVVGA